MQLYRRLALLGIVLGSSVTSPALAVSLFTASPLTGGQEVLPVVTDMSGTFDLTLNDAMTSYVWTMTVLSATSPLVGAHIHTGTIVMNGIIIDPLWDVTAVGADITGEDIVFTGDGDDLAVIAKLLAIIGGAESELYVNVHTEANLDGEIRGQLVLVPEPSTAVLLGVGLSGLTIVGRRRR